MLRRPGLVEAAVDLTRLAGVGSAAVTAAIVNDDEADVTATDVAAFARAHNLQTVDIDDLVTYLEVAAGL